MSQVGHSLARFKMIDSLDCSCAVGPSMDQLIQITGLSRLERLKIRANYTSSDAALAIIANLKRLTSLSFEQAKVRRDCLQISGNVSQATHGAVPCPEFVAK